MGVATSLTVFVGRTAMGPVNEPVNISSFQEFEQTFGELSGDYPLSYSVQDFFLNGGSQAIILRLFKGDATAGTAVIKAASGASAGGAAAGGAAGTAVTLVASSPGSWGQHLSYKTDTNGITDDIKKRYATRDWDASDLFNLTVIHDLGGGKTDSERFTNVSTNVKARARYLGVVLEQASRFARYAPSTQGQPAPTGTGSDSAALDATTYQGGLDVLQKVDLFNLVVIPPDSLDGDTPADTLKNAASLCFQKKATLIIDPPTSWTKASDVKPENFSLDIGITPASDVARYTSLYFPRIIAADPLTGGALVTRAASGMIAGVMARTDASRGVWKAPAGYEAGLIGAAALDKLLTDSENGTLNSQGVNCLRSFPATGPVIWGARTVAGSDQLADDYKYLPVRRLADLIEQTLLRQTRWAVFEPNDEPLWSQLRLAIGSFMADLFRQGAFQGSSRDQAYFVKCDASTTLQDDINKGIVNIQIGFAPLKPAEFVILYLQQQAGQLQS